MIRHFEIGELVYYTGRRTREIFKVTHKPTKAYHRYRIQALDPNGKADTLDLPTNEDRPIWDCIFKFDDHVEAKNDAIRRQNEYSARIKREVTDWAGLVADEPEVFMYNLYTAWKNRLFFADDYDADPFAHGYTPLDFHIREVVGERDRLVRQRISQFWGIDVQKE